MNDKIKTILSGVEGLEERTKNSDCGTEFRNGQNRAYVLVKELIYQKFPELQESEDERIRRWLFDIFSARNERFVEELDNYRGLVTREQLLTYLQKL